MANIEGQYAMAGHPATNLSVEQVVDCDDSKDAPKMYADCGVYGGWPYLAYQYLIRAVSEAENELVGWCMVWLWCAMYALCPLHV